MVLGAPSIDDIEDMVRGDLDAVYPMVVRRLADPQALDDEQARQRLLLVRADLEARRGDPATSARLVREVQSWATEHGDSLVLARCGRLLAWSFLRVGDTALALEHAISAVELMERGRPTLAACRGPADSRDDPQRLRLLRRGAPPLRRGQPARRGRRQLRAAAHDPQQSRVRGVHGRAHRGGGGSGGAASHRRVDPPRAVPPGAGHPRERVPVGRPARGGRTGAAPGVRRRGRREAADFDALVVCLLTLAEVQRRLGATAAAQLTLDRCRALCEKWELRGLAVQAQREQAELHAAEGRYELAYRVFKDFHEAAAALDSADREARARTLQAIFETREARLDSALFRELAEVDPLTGLRNRRFVDARLDALLVQVVDLGAPLTVALLDLDHFKAVNDTWSHDVGDMVLCRVARLLERSLIGVPDGAVARMGGEEFLLVLPGVAEADALLEDVRQAVADAGWHDLVGALAVTISIGAAIAPRDGTVRSDLLRHADRNLYAAKRRGRDRVVATSRGDSGAEALPPAIPMR